MTKKISHIAFLILFLLSGMSLFAQAPAMFKYQGIARDVSGLPLYEQNIAVKAGVYSGSATGTLEWEETQTLTTDTFGLYVYSIGTGTSTGGGSLANFNLIAWQNNTYFLKISVDFTGGTSYTPMGSAQLLSVPYSFYSNQASYLTLSLNDFADADTAGVGYGKILKWNGINWIPAIDSHHDTVSYSFTSANAVNADTSMYANSYLYTIDTVSYSYSSDSSNMSATAGSALSSGSSTYSDTATYALNFLSANWGTAGNMPTSGNFLGTADTNHLKFKTNSLERMRLLNNGKFAIGTANSVAHTHWMMNEGIIAQGNDTIGTPIDSVYSTRMMWYPKTVSFRAGQITNHKWDNANMGYYSIATGYNNQASGYCSGAFGYDCIAKDYTCFAFGYKCSSAISAGAVLGGGCITMGDSNTITQTRSVVMGYHNLCDGGIAMGANNYVVTGSENFVYGKDNTNNGFCSVAMGYHASNNGYKGCFLFSDSTAGGLANTAINQFMVRAKGGVIFYTDSMLTNGVQFFNGSGGWASVSDRKKKTNFITENPDDILNKITQLEITKWNYKTQKRKIKHIGPMAQDFYKLFNIGENNTSITTVDIDGVCLLGIKALEKQTQELSEKINNLDTIKAEIKSTADDFDSLENRLDKIEKTLNKNIK